MSAHAWASEGPVDRCDRCGIVACRLVGSPLYRSYLVPDPLDEECWSDEWSREEPSCPPGDRPRFSRQFYREIGRLGARALRAKYGAQHYSVLARLGGQAILAARGVEYYRALGRKGAAARAVRRKEGRP